MPASGHRLMDDQANHLRELVKQRGAPRPTDHRPRSKLIVVTGGSKGVGTTTIALNLALALAGKKSRTVLVDADPHGGGAARLCRVETRHKPSDSLQSRETLRELLRPGPGGLQILPASGGHGSVAGAPAASQQWLAAQFQALGSHADLVVLEAGNGVNALTGCVGRSADALLVITTPEVTAAMAAYASIKAVAAGRQSPPVYTVVNVAPSRSVARQVHLDLAQACRRFLAIDVEPVGYVGEDAAIAAAGRAGDPFLLTAPRCRPARHIRRMARRLSRALNRSPVTV